VQYGNAECGESHSIYIITHNMALILDPSYNYCSTAHILRLFFVSGAVSALGNASTTSWSHVL
jgi:hypothetical protein